MNLGNPAEMTILEFAEYVRKLTGTRSEIVSRPLPEDDPKQRRPDISKAKRLLGWSPKVELQEGLRATIAYFQEISAQKAQQA